MRRYRWQCGNESCPCATATGSCPRCGKRDAVADDLDSLCQPCEDWLAAPRRCVCGAPLLSWEPPYCSAGGRIIPPSETVWISHQVVANGGRNCRAEYLRQRRAA